MRRFIFYIVLLLLACIVAIISKRLSHLPYTIFLTLVGLAIGLMRIGPEISDTGFGHELIFSPHFTVSGSIPYKPEQPAKAILAHLLFCSAGSNNLDSPCGWGCRLVWRNNINDGGPSV